MFRAPTYQIAIALILTVGSAAELHAQEGDPLLKSDLVRMMTASNYTGSEVAAIVRMNCVGFEPTDRDRGQLENLPNADIVMAEVDRCLSRSGGLIPSAVAAEPAKSTVRTPPRPKTRIKPVDLELTPAPTGIHELRAPSTATTLGPPEIPSLARREIPPRLKNWDEITRAFLREYRPAVRVPGTVTLSLRVGVDGRVLDASVKESTGDRYMSEAALKITELMEFAPAMMRDQAVESLTELPIHFAAN